MTVLYICPVYLYPTRENALNGKRIGGCGFLTAVRGAGDGWLVEGQCPQDDFHHCYVASNRHVATSSPFVRLNTHDGRFDVLQLVQDDWTFSDKHDLAVVPIEYAKAHKYLFVGTSAFLTEKLAATHDIGIGDDVFMVGRFISHDGTQRNSPSARFGYVSMMPGEPIHHPSNPSCEQISFLVEIFSVGGYSGSPVFVRPFPAKKVYAQSTLNTVVYSSGLPTSEDFRSRQGADGGPWLLGVEWGYINSHDQRANNTGVSGVVPAWFLRDLLDTPKLKEQRKDEQRRLLERFRLGGATLT